MADKVSYKWSSNIGSWDGYWVDRDFFNEKYGEIEESEDGLTADGETLEEVQEKDEELRFVEPPAFIDWLITKQNAGFSVERVWIHRETRTDPSKGDMQGYMPHVEVTGATVEFSINPEASQEQREKLEGLMGGSKVDPDTGTIEGAHYDDDYLIRDPNLTGGSTDPTVLQGEL